MKSPLWLLCVALLGLASCQCGDDDDGSGGALDGDDDSVADDDTYGDDDSLQDDDSDDDNADDDDTAPDDDDDTMDDDAGDDDSADDDASDDDASDDDTLDDDMSDDDAADDDTGADDDTEVVDCLWQADLPPEDGYEWRTSTIAELINGGSVELVFDGEVPVAFWLEYVTTSYRELYRARLDDIYGSAWDVKRLHDPAHTLGAFDVDLTPDAEIEFAFNSSDFCELAGPQLCICSFQDDEIQNCRGAPWTGVSPPIVSFDHTPDGRPGLLFLDTIYHPWYTEETAPGVWELGTIPINSFAPPGNLAIGPDGVAHFTWLVQFLDNEWLLHFFGTVGQTWGVEFVRPTGEYPGNLVATPTNDLYMPFSEFETGVLHRQGPHRWDLIELAPVTEGLINGFSLDYDTQSRLHTAYGLSGESPNHNTRYVCWARREGDLWRKEMAAREDDVYQSISPVHGVVVSPGGVVGVPYNWREWDGQENHEYLGVALRVPVKD
ncbi:hypothetical protein K8I61_09615 [bacterium]|nr:hypothetical protein [bacterium]